MQTAELTAALRSMIPQFALVDGVYVRLRDSVIPQSLQNEIARYKGNLKYLEQDFNRFFIVANFLDHVVEERRGWDKDDLLMVADVCAALVRDGLRRAFPDQRFDIEIIGQNLVDDEPLELCVTFSRTNL
jgi:hypothetical protein